jgi:S1-C subfamily serine protease
VVNIDTVGRSKLDDGGGSFFESPEVRGKGSGVIITPDGYIVTNNHVIEGAKRIRVTLPTGGWYYAHLIGTDPITDLAVVRIDASGLPAAELGDSDKLQVGEWSIAVGNPLGLGSTTTVGVISALNRRNLQVEEGRSIDGAIQTDAAINRGNSGGALANINGQLIGINTAILSSTPNGGSIGLGFALPANTVRRVAKEIIMDGKAHTPVRKRPWLGIRYGSVLAGSLTALNLPKDTGIRITRIFPDSPADAAGLLPEDIILSIDGKPIGDERDVQEAVQNTAVGEKCTVHIARPSAHNQLDIPVIIRARPESVE